MNLKISIYFLLLCMFSLNLSHAATGIDIPRSDGKATPVKLYGDWGATNCSPVIVASHGLGGSERGLSFIGDAFSQKGYRVVVMGHTNVNEKADLRKLIFGGNKAEIIADQVKFASRFLDLEATLKYVTQNCSPAHLFLIGHSLGAATTIIEAGAIPNVAQRGQKRFHAYIALSQQGVGTLFNEGAWSGITEPVLMITGTKDKGVDGDYTTRLSSFDGLPKGQKRLAIIEGANHMNLGGRRSKQTREVMIELIDEFLLQVQSGSFEPSQVKGVDIREK